MPKGKYSDYGKYQSPGSAGGTDADAIHDNVASEISAITEKANPTDGDWVIIEDAEDSNNKKKVDVSNLPGAGTVNYVDVNGFADEATYLLFPMFVHANRTVTANTISGTSDQLVCYMEFFPVGFKCDSVSIYVTTNRAGSTATVGLYALNGDKELDSGTLDTASASGHVSASFTAYTISPGWHYVIYTNVNTGTAPSVASCSGNTNLDTILNNVCSQSVIATAANSASSGVLPATLGALTGVTNRQRPFIGFGGST